MNNIGKNINEFVNLQSPVAYRHKESGDIYLVTGASRNACDAEQILVNYVSTVSKEYPAGTIWSRPYNDFVRKFERFDDFSVISVPCRQEPLGVEFAKVLYDNINQLYQE